MDFKLEFVLNSHHPPIIQMSPTLMTGEGSNAESGGREGSNGERGGSPGLAFDILEWILSGDVFVDRHTLSYSSGCLVLMKRRCGLKLIPDILSKKRKLERFYWSTELPSHFAS
ncbi:uncharacterized protein A4U43_UnF260 [Asparagus officinalis]|uniref:Uncharacterized protein n=1 Tax=Asparagus officinalis TaxID=4686 RepID=A0A1R3L7U4_ASPOF|nr:uncharacterized protein A4U43_UnF260 [Asparagus officinalis]